MRKSGDTYAGIFFILLGIGVCIRSVTLQIGTLTEPKPGFFPFLGGSILIFFNIILLIQTSKKLIDEGLHNINDLRKPGLLIIGILIYILIFNSLGYLLSTILLAMAVLRIMEIKSFKVLIIASVSAGVCTYLLFNKVLGISLPAGVTGGIF